MLAILEAAKPRVKVPADPVPGESLFPGSQTVCVCPEVTEGARERAEVSFVRTLSPFMRAPPSGPISLKRPHVGHYGQRKNLRRTRSIAKKKSFQEFP